jgi:hypothetical protein
LCTLQVGPDCDEKYSRKRHRISAIAAAWRRDADTSRKKPVRRPRVRSNRSRANSTHSRLRLVTQIGIFCAGGTARKQ